MMQKNIFKNKLFQFFSGLILCLILLEGGLRFLGYLYNKKYESNLIDQYGQQKDDRTIIAIGDSYTWGGEVAPTDTYPAQLEKFINSSENQKYRVVNAGLCESNSTMLLSRLKQFLESHYPKQVVLLVGSANRYNLKGYESYSKNRENVLSRLRVVNLLKIFQTNLKGAILRSKIKKYEAPPMTVSDRSYTDFMMTGENTASMAGIGQNKTTHNQEIHIPYVSEGDLYFRQGEYEKALAMYQKAFDIKKDNFQGLVRMAKYYIEHLEHHKAEEIINTIIKAHPENLEMRILLGLCYRKQKRFDLAEQILTPLTGKSPTPYTLGAFFELGLVYQSQGKYQEAEKLYKDCIETYGALAHHFRIELGYCYMNQRKFHLADEMFKEGFNKNIPSHYVNRSLCFREQGDYARAEEFLRQAISRWPASEEPRLELAHLYLTQRKFNDTFEAYQAVLKTNPRNGEAYIGLGHSYRFQKDYKRAGEMYKKAMQADLEPEKQFEPYAYYGYLMLASGQYDNAFEYICKAVEFNPWNEDTYYLMSRAYELQSQYDSDYFMEASDRIIKKYPSMKQNKTLQYYREFFRDKKVWERKANQWLIDDLDQIVSLCQKRNIQLIILNYPYPYTTVNKILQDTALKYQLPFVDNYSVFEKLVQLEGRDKYFTDFDHCTEEGLRIMAKNVYDVLFKEKKHSTN